MILRRIASAFRHQDWFTVVLEVVIVVLGVFIGIEVANWNEARGAAQREMEYLQQLRNEIVTNNERLEYRVDYTRTVVASAERVAAFLEREAPCGDDCAELLRDLFFSSQLWGGNLSDIVATEMQRQGLPGSIPMKRAIQSYYSYADGLEKTLDTAAHYRTRVRRLIPLEHQRRLWSDCFTLESGEIEILDTVCRVGISNGAARDVMTRVRTARDLLGDLYYWAGMNELWMVVFADQVSAGRALVDMIEQELEASR
ncbi:hypothetical protein G4Y73_05165 [Wenzhouxiangella sp. XN201]|uniref:hypothetical protein n=1 Tax=Wenzhouxiangella sp. XN201 TaxID=2710755 RepID=UPI0013C9A986|nr:hypothetical protein [Wenzhouxiangella sp. XN201]NEZ03541.1 hypothetical protein [Wenzhouxiangella sp. XN201]